MMGIAPCVHAGQGCANPTRLLLPRSRYDEGVEILKGISERGLRRPQRPGQPVRSGDIAPAARSGAGLHRQGEVAEGATSLVGGSDAPARLDKGFFVKPTLFVDVDNSMTIAQEEIFGPVLCGDPVRGRGRRGPDRQRQPVRGGGNVMSGSRGTCVAVARRVRAGFIGVNGGVLVTAPTLPSVDTRRAVSDGRTASAGFEQYTEVKSVAYPAGPSSSGGQTHTTATDAIPPQHNSWTRSHPPAPRWPVIQMEEHMSEDLTDVDFFPRRSTDQGSVSVLYSPALTSVRSASEARCGVGDGHRLAGSCRCVQRQPRRSRRALGDRTVPGFPVPIGRRRRTGLIGEHRDGLPFSDQVPTMDPPKHTAHRALLMRLITPKRLKENEEHVAARRHRARRSCVPAGATSSRASRHPSPCVSSPICSVCPKRTAPSFTSRIAHGTHGGGRQRRQGVWPRAAEYLYEISRRTSRTVRTRARDDVSAGLRTAKFPDGSLPEIMDVVRIATNVYSAGQETTVRLLSTAFKVLAENPELQQA